MENHRNDLPTLRSHRVRYAMVAIAAVAIVVALVASFRPPQAELPAGIPAGEAAAERDVPPPSDSALDRELTAALDTAAADAAAAPAVEPPAGASPAQAPSPLDPSLRVRKPTHVRGLYLNAWATGSSRKLAKLIDIADRTEVNAFVIDVKEVGEISYRTSVPLANEVGAGRNYVSNIRGVLATLREHGIYPIARIVAFRDPLLAKARPDLAVQKEDGSVWLDNHGHAWVDSYNREVWDYNIALAREAIELGFSEVQWDYVRFPDVPRSYMRTAVWPAQAGRTKEDGIREFLLYSREQLADLGAPVTADVFGLTVSARDDMGIGQLWEKMVDATDVLLPMVYPSHFARGSYGIPYPNAEPRRTVLTSMGHAVRRTEGREGAATIRPWLQDFTLGQPRYGAWHVREQIDGVYDAGLTEWVLWHPGSNYTVAALADANGVVPRLAPPAPPAPPTAEPDTAPVILGVPVDTIGGSGRQR